MANFLCILLIQSHIIELARTHSTSAAWHHSVSGGAEITARGSTRFAGLGWSGRQGQPRTPFPARSSPQRHPPLKRPWKPYPRGIWIRRTRGVRGGDPRWNRPQIDRRSGSQSRRGRGARRILRLLQQVTPRGAARRAAKAPRREGNPNVGLRLAPTPVFPQRFEERGAERHVTAAAPFCHDLPESSSAGYRCR